MKDKTAKQNTSTQQRVYFIWAEEGLVSSMPFGNFISVGRRISFNPQTKQTRDRYVAYYPRRLAN